MNRYREYKDSGVEWVGEIPSHWRVRRLKYGAYLIGEKGVPSKTEVRISPEDIVSGLGICLNYYSEHEGVGVRFEGGDVLLNKLRLYLAKIFYADQSGYSMGEMIVLRASHDLDGRYLFYLLFHRGLLELLDSQSTGIKMPRVAPEVILYSLLPLPVLTEQKAIATYLDHKTALIDSLIAKTEQKIALLKELRSATINHAVTKGLDPNVKMKESGVEWIGEIPEEWEVTRLKYCVSCNDEVLPESTDPSLEIDYVEIGDVEYPVGVVNSSKVVFGVAPSRARRIGRRNDVVISTVRTYLKAIAQVDDSMDGFIFSTGFAVLRPRRILPRFLSYVMLCEGLLNEIVANSSGISYPAITSTRLLEQSIVLPPVSVQEAIVKVLDKESLRYDTLVVNLQKSIGLLREYRQSLISDVVTGKICVLKEDEIRLS